MQKGFNPDDPAALRKQIELSRKLAALTRNPEVRARLKSLAARYEKKASGAA